MPSVPVLVLEVQQNSLSLLPFLPPTVPFAAPPWQKILFAAICNMFSPQCRFPSGRPMMFFCFYAMSGSDRSRMCLLFPVSYSDKSRMCLPFPRMSCPEKLLPSLRGFKPKQAGLTIKPFYSPDSSDLSENDGNKPVILNLFQDLIRLRLKPREMLKTSLA